MLGRQELLDLMIDNRVPAWTLEAARRKLRLNIWGLSRGFRSRFTEAIVSQYGQAGLARYLHPVAGGSGSAAPTLIAQRSGLFYQSVKGGLPAILDTHIFPANVLFAASGWGSDSAGYGDHPDRPTDTIDYAIGLCTANQGDVILVQPAHAETIAAAGGITSDVAGVHIEGLGRGADIPTVTFSATDSTWAISGRSTSLKRLKVTSSVNELVSMFNVTGADVVLDNVDYVDPGAAKETLQFLLTTSAADRLTVKNCKHYASTAGASAQKWIALVGCDQPTIEDCIFILKLFDHATSSVINGDASVTMAALDKLRIHLTGYSSALLSAILMASGATGIISNSRIYADVAANTSINDFPTGASFEVYCSNAADKNGILDPVADT